MTTDSSVSGSAPTQPEQQKHPGTRQQRVGRVTSDKMQKTIVVSVEALKQHRIYKRSYRQTTKFKAHDENNVARIGDTVLIEETRPLSKDKRWRLVKILNRVVQVTPVEQAAAQLDQNVEGEA